jgi:hypothetical protein
MQKIVMGIVSKHFSKFVEKTMFLLCLISFVFGYSQENKFSRNSIKTGVGVGYNMGVKEDGLGTLSMIGYERSYGKKGRLRMNASLLIGGFTSYGISDSRDNYYRTTSWNINANYDFVKYKAVSLFIYSGGFANYSRGMLGSGFSEVTLKNYESQKFANLYFGVNLGFGLRINPPSNRCAFEIKPINIQTGSKEFLNFYMMFGVDIKIKN